MPDHDEPTAAELAVLAAARLTTGGRPSPTVVAVSAAAAAAAAVLTPVFLLAAVVLIGYAVTLDLSRRRTALRVLPEVAALIRACGAAAAADVCRVPAAWWRHVPEHLAPERRFAYLVAVLRADSAGRDCRSGHRPLCAHRAPREPVRVATGASALVDVEAAVFGRTHVAEVLACPPETCLLAVFD